jgi:hypothetical protein
MRSRTALALVGALAGILASCGPEGARSDAPSAAAPAESTLLEDFEQDPTWTLDSANDYAALSSTERAATSGKLGLQVDYADSGRDKVVLRKEVDLDLSGVERLLIDAQNQNDQAIDFALALRSKDGALWELAPLKLAPGWNRDLSFRLDEKGFKAPFDAAKWKLAATSINRLLIYVVPAKADGHVAIDDLRYAPAKAAVQRRDAARIVAVAPPPARAQRFGRVELGIDVAYPPPATLTKDALGDPFMRRMLSAQARVAAPDGTTFTANAFCAGIEERDGVPVYRYRVRLAPDCAGEWRCQLGVEAGGRWSWADQTSFVVADEAAGPGPIRVDAADPRWLARADGSFFYPLGENVAWSGDYEPYAAALEAAGANTMRVWICPWNDPLETGGKLESVSFDSAARIDRMFEVAAKHGLAVQLCLQYHGMLGGDWGRNPFNKANGGPCTDAREFWSTWQARAVFKRYLDYVVARWGAEPQLLAWELWNEADLTPRFRDEDIVSWHREIAEHLRRADPHHHLVTTSVSWPGALPDLWREARLDLAEAHHYAPRAPQAIQGAASALAPTHLPLIIGEYGRGWEAADDQPDRDGRSLRQALWCGWMQGLAGAPLPWWWDTHVEPNRLTARFTALAAFLKGEDPRGLAFRPVAMGLGDHLEADCLIAADRAYGYVFAPETADRPGAAPLAALVPPGKRLVVSGLAPGLWRLQLWDVDGGKIVHEGDVQAGDEGAAIELPAMPGEIAFKLKRLRVAAPGVRLE